LEKNSTLKEEIRAKLGALLKIPQQDRERNKYPRKRRTQGFSSPAIFFLFIYLFLLPSNLAPLLLIGQI
jgi:hypothetical protein